MPTYDGLVFGGYVFKADADEFNLERMKKEVLKSGYKTVFCHEPTLITVIGASEIVEATYCAVKYLLLDWPEKENPFLDYVLSEIKESYEENKEFYSWFDTKPKWDNMKWLYKNVNGDIRFYVRGELYEQRKVFFPEKQTFLIDLLLDQGIDIWTELDSIKTGVPKPKFFPS